MDINTDEVLKNAIRDGIKEGIKGQFNNNYSSPLGKLINAAIETHTMSFRGLLEEAISSAINDKDFRSEVVSATRTVMAKTLVQKFGGELEKQVNALKSDPMTRARIVLAIEEIVKGNS